MPLPQRDMNLELRMINWAEELRVVDSVRAVGQPEMHDDFTTSHAQYTLDDGTRYPVRVYQPSEQRFDTGVTYTTPWFTHLDSFNSRVGQKAAQAGMVAVEVGPGVVSRGDALRLLGKVSLFQDVQAHHAILDSLDAQGRYEPGKIIPVGYSRGAMIGFGLNASAKTHGREIVYADFLDPCLEHKVSPSDLNPFELSIYAGEELLTLSKELLHYSPSELFRIARSAANPSAYYLLQQLAVGKALFSGEAGRFVEGWEPDLSGHVTLYTNSKFNHAAQWEERLSQYGNVAVSVEPGWHLSGVDPDVLRSIISRTVLAQELMRDNANVAEIGTAIRDCKPAKGTRPAFFSMENAASLPLAGIGSALGLSARVANGVRLAISTAA